jgi:hypothetical protein
MVVALEKAKLADQQLVVAAGGNNELQQQVDILKETVKLMNDQIVAYKNMDEMKTKMSAAKDELHAQELKAATPTFMQNAGKYAIGGVGGAILMGLAILLL